MSEGTSTPPASDSAAKNPVRTGGSDDEPVLPDITSDEGGAGWGDEPSRRDDEWYLSERPPHHG